MVDTHKGKVKEVTEKELLDHLAACSYCRCELVVMLRRGVIVLPEAEATPEPRTASTPDHQVWRNPPLSPRWQSVCEPVGDGGAQSVGCESPLTKPFFCSWEGELVSLLTFA